MISNYGTNTIGVFRNISTPGNIIFDNRIDYGISGGYPTGVTAIDVNGDGKPELMTSVNGNGNFMSVFKNTSVPGVISFDLKVSYPTGNWPRGIKASDIDGDSKLDIIVTNLNSSTISVYRNLSTSTISFAPKQDFPTGNGPTSFTICDFDGDGKPDIAEQNYYSDKTTSLLKNTSTVGNISILPKFNYALVQSAYKSVAGDMDGDGLPDLLTFDLLSGTTAIFRNTCGSAVVVQLCAPGNTTITSDITGTTYQWQQNTGSGFSNISNNINFSGTNTITLGLINIPLSWNGYQYRCLVNGNYSIVTTINLTTLPVASAGVDQAICAGGSTQLNGSGGATYSWSPITGLSNPNISNPVASPAVTTAYILTVSNSVACFSKDTVVITVNPLVTPNVTITTPITTVCSGSSVTFTATSTNGGTNPAYQWQVNGINTGLNSTTFTTNTLINGDQVSVILTSNASCVTTIKDTSNVITVSVNTGASASVNITTPITTICSGVGATFTATPVNGGATPSYQWQVNGVNAGNNSNTFTTSALNNNDQVKVIMTSSLNCASPPNATSNIITMTITPTPAANAGNDIAICAGSSVQLQGSGGTTYLWSPATGLSNPNIANPIATPLVTTAYILMVTNGGTCNAKDTILITVNPSVTPLVINSATSNNICSGTSVTFTATSTNAGTTPTYQWQVNGVNAGTNNSTFTTSTLANNAQVKVILTSSLTCALPATATSNVITMTVNATPIANAGNDVIICTGGSVQLQASGGATYSWSPVAGLNNPNIANPVASPAVTTIYTVTVSNGINCTATDAVVVTVGSPVTPVVTISTTNNSICQGSAATFTAVATNGGSNPAFQWQVNGINAGTNNNIFITSTLNNNDQVKAILTSSNGCVTSTTATSNTITVTVDQLATPVISLTNRLFTVTNPDAAAAYTWQQKINNTWGNVLPAATGITYTAALGGEYRVKAVKNACTAYSLSQATLRNLNTLLHPFGIYLYPNPNTGILNIDSIRINQKWETLDITDVTGRVVLTFNIKNQSSVSLNISMLKPGTYFAQLKKIDGVHYTVEFVKL